MKKRIFKIAFPISITSCIRSGLSSLKQFLIPLRLSMSGMTYQMAVSGYGLISGMVMPVLLFANVFIASFSGLLVPEFSRLLAGKNTNRMKYICNTIFKSTFIFSIAMSSVFLFYGNELSILIYQNLEAGKWIKILAPLVFFMYIDNVIDNILKGINEQVSVMFCNIIDLVVTITIIFFVVPHLGITGYILSIFVSELLNFTISSIQLRKRITFSINVKNICIKPIIACILAYGVTMFFNFSFLPFLWNVVFKIASFIGVYALIIFLFNIKSADRYYRQFHN